MNIDNENLTSASVNVLFRSLSLHCISMYSQEICVQCCYIIKYHFPKFNSTPFHCQR